MQQSYPLLWLHSIDDALTPAANWVLALQDKEKSLEETISVKIRVNNIKSFQDNVGIPFVSLWKQISLVALAHKMWYLHVFNIFDPKKTPKLDSSEYSNYGKDSLSILLHQYGLPRTALSLDGEEFQKQELITDEVYVEWTTFHHYIAKQPKEEMSSQLQQMKRSTQCSPICIPWPMFVCHFQLGLHQWREAFQMIKLDSEIDYLKKVFPT